MRRLRPHLTYANVMVTLLAFVVLCGGTAFAAAQLAKNSVGTKQLKRNAVTGAKVKDGSLRPQDIRGLAAIQGPAGPSGAGPSFQAKGSVNFDKFSASPYGSTVVTLNVPPGLYFATSSVTAETVNGVTSTVLCRLINGVGGEGSAAVLRSQSVRADGSSDSFTLTALLSVASGQALNLQCSKTVAGSSARITDANIVAVQVQSISGLPG